MSGRLVKADAIAEVRWASVMQCLEVVGEELELCSFVYGEPVELLQVWCDVSAA